MQRTPKNCAQTERERERERLEQVKSTSFLLLLVTVRHLFLEAMHLFLEEFKSAQQKRLSEFHAMQTQDRPFQITCRTCSFDAIAYKKAAPLGS